MMNKYRKYCPNVYVAECTEQHEKGAEIILTTKYGKENVCIVHNLVFQKEGLYYYSITRKDGFDHKQWALRRAMKYSSRSISAYNKAMEHRTKADRDKDFLSLLEPIKIGHHSEKRHRKAIENAQNNMFKFVEFYKKSKELQDRIDYWESKADEINLSMPDSLEYYEIELYKATEYHKGMKEGSIPRGHSMALSYAKKKVNELTDKLKTARKLWA